MRVFTAAALIVMIVVAAIVGSYVLGLRALDSSQHNWCSALVILTERPVAYPAHAAKNPSRVAAYQFYESLIRLERKFGC